MAGSPAKHTGMAVPFVRVAGRLWCRRAGRRAADAWTKLITRCTELAHLSEVHPGRAGSARSVQQRTETPAAAAAGWVGCHVRDWGIGRAHEQVMEVLDADDEWRRSCALEVGAMFC